MRYLGIDYGTVRVGLALSDESGHMGFPHSILNNSPRLVDDLLALIAQEKVGAVVVGESKDFAGRDNKIAEAARELGAQVRERAGIPVFFESETLTSVEARRAPVEEKASLRMSRGGTRKPPSHDAIDDSAAALILTSYLSRTHHE